LFLIECAAKNGRSVVEHHPSSYWEQPFSQPYFDNTTKRETTTTVGQSAYLHCRVRNLGDRAVSPKFPYQEPVVVITVPEFENIAFRGLKLTNPLNITIICDFDRFRRSSSSYKIFVEIILFEGIFTSDR